MAKSNKPNNSSLSKPQASPPPADPPAAAAAPVVPTAQTKFVAQVEYYHHQGPLPDPRTLEYYERVCRGAANEILEMAKSEQRHRHVQDGRSTDASTLGQWFAFIIAMTGLVGGMTLVGFDRLPGGLTVFLSSLGTLIGIAVWQKKKKASSDEPQPPAGAK